MTHVQVLLDCRGATPEELAATAATLLAEVAVVEVVQAEGGTLAALTDRFGDRVRRARTLRRDVPVLVAPRGALFARGSVRRVLADVARPGRCLTCVLVPGAQQLTRVTCWAPAWLADYRGTVEELVGADLAFDRRVLPPRSPAARAWLRADVVGVASTSDVQGDVGRWARRAGVGLRGRHLVSSVRSPLGVVRRRLGRRRQRRASERAGSGPSGR